MATTKNHKITTTLQLAISYAMNDKEEDHVIKDLDDSIAYTTNDKTGKIVYHTIYSTLNCWSKPYNDFMEIIHKYGQEELKNGNKQSKDGKPILAWHWHQNFEGIVDPVLANEIGRKLAAEVFSNYKVVIGTHTNTENTHNHIIVCAWDNNGKKWHNHNAMYRHIREVSDRLCEEYGLPILLETKKQKLIKWKDANGKTHYYEPTARKNEMIRQRESGEISEDRVGSYRNTVSYEMSESRKEYNREIVRRDIDRLLPVAASYEHLLQMLRQIGYEVKDRKKNGEWLQHIVFIPPAASKGTRDYKITDDGFYIRANLERVIEEFNADRKVQEGNKEYNSIPYFDEYVYGKIAISEIDENYKKVREQDGSLRIMERAETEKKVIIDVKEKDRELCRLIDTTELDRLIKEQQSRNKNMSKRREEILVHQIQESLQALRFMEQENLYSQKQINILAESTWSKYNDCIGALDKLENIISHLEQIIKVPEKMANVERRIESMESNPAYMEFEKGIDTEELEGYKKIIEKYRLSDQESLKKMIMKVENARLRIEQLKLSIHFYARKLQEYDQCTKILNRIDKETGKDNLEIMKEYESVKTRGESEADRGGKTDNSRKEKMR